MFCVSLARQHRKSAPKVIKASPRRKLHAAADPDRLSDAYSLAICIVRPIMIDCIVALTTKMEEDGNDDGVDRLRNRVNDGDNDGTAMMMVADCTTKPTRK